ncbi:nitrogenase component 1 [Methanobrevibacter filiformis]|uniref:Nitrogenase iron-iron protein beta chain n=1 Tax=Methanobrevibacter filiformis TaxID=55758 RepID=A0A166D0U2_9EURY|nr:nitrogenase component 1 [Methanobrevibacter filiformis]KZX15081.1 nitrogenase iron-iron protein beta chain [Methanobrevibacter filiformis]
MSDEAKLENLNKHESSSIQLNSYEGESVEAPRYSCALSGAYGTTLGIRGAVPILHSGAGCGIGQLFGTLYAGGQSAGGNEGGTSTPCSCLVEEHVIFGGEEKLRNLIASTIEVFNSDLFVVISGCVPSLIGDDVDAIVGEFRDKAPIVHVNAPGFSGSSFEGYELFWDAIIEQLLIPKEKQEKLVNIFGVVPYNHVFWKGELLTIKNLLEKIGIEANIIFTEKNGLEHIEKIPAAEYNIVVSPWNGHAAAAKLEDKFGTPFITFPSVPVGPKQTGVFLRKIAEKLNVPSETVEDFIAAEEDRTYRFMEYPADAVILVRPHSYFAVAADSGTAVGITNFLTNEIGYLPDVIQITDNPPEEYRAEIAKEIGDNLTTSVVPDIIFEADTYNIRENFKDRPFLFLFSSSLEAPTAMEDFGALHISASFPVFNKTILLHNFAGYDGCLTLFEDLIGTFVGPL